MNVMLNGFGEADEIKALRAGLTRGQAGQVAYNHADMSKPNEIGELVTTKIHAWSMPWACPSP